MSQKNYIVDCKSIDSKNELLECVKNNLILGIDARNPNNFYLFKVLDSNNIEILKFGLISEDNLILPKTLIIENKNLLMVGYNNRITAVKILQSVKYFELELNGNFMDILVVENEDILLILNEIGILAINYAGEKIWSYESDLIVNYRLDNNTLNLEFLDDDSIKLSVSNGTVQK